MEGASAPFALIAAERGVRRLYAVDERASALGLFAGQKATDAMALVPELDSADADPEGDAASLSALVDWCVRFSPAAAADAPDGLFLDISGVAHLWGGERALLDDLLARLAGQGIPARGAIAGSAARPGRWPGSARTAPWRRRAPKPSSWRRCRCARFGLRWKPPPSSPGSGFRGSASSPACRATRSPAASARRC